MMHRRFAGPGSLFVFAFALGSGTEIRADFETPTAITNGRIILSSGEVIEKGTIVIDEGRIIAVGPDVRVPVDAEVFDASNLIIYPGFIDAAAHVGIAPEEPDEEALKRLGDDPPETSQGPQPATMMAYRRLIHPHWRAAELFDPKAAKREDFRQAGITVALVSPKSAILSGRSAVFETGESPLRRSIILADFAQHAAFISGVRRGRFPSNPRYPTTTMGAMAAFRQILMDSRWHRDLIDWCKRHPQGERPPTDRDLEALWDVLDGRTPVAFFANSENEIHRALDMAAEFNLRPMIVGAREGWKVADRLKGESVPVIVSLKWSDEPEKGKVLETKDEEEPSAEVTPRWLDRRPVFDEDWQKQRFEPEKLYQERLRLWEEEVDNAQRLHEAGVRFAIGSFEMKSPKEVLKRLTKVIERGLPEEAALAALTRDAATVLGLEKSLGEIAPGRMANLTLLSKPLAEKKAKVKWVFVGGKADDVSKKDKRPKGKGKPKGGEPEETPGEEEVDEDSEDAASQPSTAPAEEDEVWPEFACEIKADRKPRVQTGGNLLIKNATLLTITDGDRAETDLMIEEGRISAIGGNLTAPSGVKTLDLSGYCILPGMIDPHSHICSEGGLNEFSLSVTPEVRVRDVVDHTEVAAFRALAGGITTVHTMHGSANTIGGQNVVLRLKYGDPASQWRFAEAPQTVKFALGENVKRSNSRNRSNRFPSTRMGVEAVMRRSFDAARQYKADWAHTHAEKAAGKDPRPLRKDLRLQALADIQDGNIWVHCHCYRADEILRLFDVAETYGFRIGVLQHVLEGYRVIPEMRRHGCGASTFSDWWAYKLEAYDAIPHNASRIAQGGVVATVNSDSAEVVRHMNLEAAKSLRFGGLSSNDALRLVTLNAAIQLGIDRYVGSIEAGKLADLAVFDGHPLDTFSKCVLTLIDGEVRFQHPGLDFANPATPMPIRGFEPAKPPMVLQPSSNGEYWIVGGRIHPVSSGPIEDGVLVISGGKIKEVGPRTGRTPPAGASVIDARGLNVYPGLINAGAPLGLVEIGSVAGSVDTGDLARFQPDLMALSAYNPHSAGIAVARSEGVTTCLVPPGGGVVQGQAGLVRLDGWSMPEARAASPIGMFVSVPSLPLRFPDWMPEEMREEREKNYRETLPKVEAFFRKAKHYANVSAAAEEEPQLAPEHDRKLAAMIPYMRGELPILFRANSYKQILEALKFAERFGIRPVIFGGREAWKLAEALAGQKVDVIIVRSMAYPSGDFEPFDSVYRCADVLHRAGVRFCFATSNPSLVKQVGIEAGMAAAHGLDPEHAIRAMTLDAAAVLGVDDRLGSLEPGKRADLIITTDSPLQASNRVVASFIDGRPVDLSNKHSQLDEKFRQRPEPDLPPDPTLRGPSPMRLGGRT